MSKVRRRGDRIVLPFGQVEVSLLVSLVGQLVGLLEVEDAAPADDPFSTWEREFHRPVGLDLSDPVIQRLFPPAYEGDHAAEAEFRRFAEEGQRQRKQDDALLVLEGLSEAAGGTVSFPVSEAEAWLKTLNALRLSLAVRLEVEKSGPEAFDDLPRTIHACSFSGSMSGWPARWRRFLTS